MIEIYRSKYRIFGQRWYWRLTAANNRVVAASSEGFYDRVGALENARLTYTMLAAHFASTKP